MIIIYKNPTIQKDEFTGFMRVPPFCLFVYLSSHLVLIFFIFQQMKTIIIHISFLLIW
jgi:hypothetical protein